MPHVNELHEQHDPILVVSLASGDLATADRDYATAQTLVADCADCARLHDDVLAIASATKALPPAARSRDFRLSAEQAAKLRPAGVRGVLARLTAPGGLFSRQLGAGLAALGVAGLLIGSLGSINLGMSAAMPAAGGAAAASMPASAPEYAVQASPAAATGNPDQAFTTGGAEAAATLKPGEGDTSASQPPDTTRTNLGGAAATSAPTLLPAPANNRDAEQPLASTAPADLTSTGGPSPLIVVSTALLIAGALVLVVRQLARGSRPR